MWAYASVVGGDGTGTTFPAERLAAVETFASEWVSDDPVSAYVDAYDIVDRYYQRWRLHKRE